MFFHVCYELVDSMDNFIDITEFICHEHCFPMLFPFVNVHLAVLSRTFSLVFLAHPGAIPETCKPVLTLKSGLTVKLYLHLAKGKLFANKHEWGFTDHRLLWRHNVVRLCNVELTLWKKLSWHQEEPRAITIGLETVKKPRQSSWQVLLALSNLNKRGNVINPVEQDMVKRNKVNKIP